MTTQEKIDFIRSKCIEANPRRKHGMYGTPIYNKWTAMKRRCLNKRDKRYACYGGRGVKICDKWLDFVGFYADMGESFKNGLTLERINNELGYSKENCKWIPMSEQAKNRRNVPIYELNGVKLNASAWDKKLGLKEGTVRIRIKHYHWPIDKALTLKRFERAKTA